MRQTFTSPYKVSTCTRRNKSLCRGHPCKKKKRECPVKDMPGHTHLVHVHMNGNVLRNARNPEIRSTSSVIGLRFLLTNFYLVYKDEK